MGDKSPKSKDKAKKQHSNEKNQKAAATKARTPQAGDPAAKKGK